MTGERMEIPSYGFGTYQLLGPVATELVRTALDSGLRYIDTAQAYFNESEVGQAIRDSGVERAEVFLTTKVDNARHEPAEVVRSVEESLDKLDVDYVDLLLLHWPNEWHRMPVTLEAMSQLRSQGKALRLGVSNFTIGQLEIARAWAPLDVLQVECHPFFSQVELRAWCVQNGWDFTAYSPLGKGKVFHSSVLGGIARDHAVTEGAVALAWLMAKPGVNVIPRTSSVVHLGENNRSRELQLHQDEIDRIDALHDGIRLIDPAFGPWNDPSAP